jgi:hypothetical protein
MPLVLAPAYAAPQRGARLRPPAGIVCPLATHYLTAYIGVVVGAARAAGQTKLTIRTDWDTTEEVAIEHKGSPDAMKWFLYRGTPFTVEHWGKITDASGEFRRGLRASAWVCSDGSNPTIDWDVPAEP